LKPGFKVTAATPATAPSPPHPQSLGFAASLLRNKGHAQRSCSQLGFSAILRPGPEGDTSTLSSSIF
ncbi:hypothetical protein FRC10_004836, partial [Ceratobasidium sp. 414]